MPPAPPSTRNRIVDTCRRLFNERGPVAVTTAEIAASVGINEGNLYYHFKTKERMLHALFERFERDLAELDARPATAGADPDAERLKRFFDLVWNWRFLYRDTLSLGALAPTLRGRIVDHAATTQAGMEASLRRMIAEGRLVMPEAKVPVLVTNAWIVCTYWVQYLQFNRGVSRITRRHLEQGYEQVRALYLPYLVRPRAA